MLATTNPDLSDMLATTEPERALSRFKKRGWTFLKPAKA
jgi:hypothetical protein